MDRQERARLTLPAFETSPRALLGPPTATVAEALFVTPTLTLVEARDLEARPGRERAAAGALAIRRGTA